MIRAAQIGSTLASLCGRPSDSPRTLYPYLYRTSAFEMVTVWKGCDGPSMDRSHSLSRREVAFTTGISVPTKRRGPELHVESPHGWLSKTSRGRPFRLPARRPRAAVVALAKPSTDASIPIMGGDFPFKPKKTNTRTKTFEDWLKENGVYLSDKATWGRTRRPLGIADETTDNGEPSGRGLIALKSLNQGEPVLEIPEKLVMSKARALEALPNLDEGVNDYVALASLLIHERSLGKESFWKPYLDILPEDEEIVPLFRWSDEDLALLEGSPSVAAAKSLSAKLQREFKAVEESVFEKHRDMFPSDVFTFPAWEWAFAVLFSRAIMLQSEGNVALVPYADLVNHSPFCSSYIDMHTTFLTGNKNVILYSDRAYSKMDQVFVTYGPKSNAELLLLYGFVIDRNPYNCVDLTVGPDPSDPLYERKLEYLRTSGVEEENKFPLYNDRYPMELIECLRFCVATEEELDSSDFGSFVSERNEQQVADALTAACESALAAYPQDIDADKMFLSDRNMYLALDTKTRCAIRQRMGEKQILQRTINNIERERAEPSFLFAGPSSSESE